MNAFIIKFLREESKSNPWLFFKAILLLIPILSIVGMFATVQLVSHINQISFLRNSDYEWISYCDDKPEHVFSFRVMDKTRVAHIISTTEGGGMFYRPLTIIDLFLVEDLDPPSWERSYFNSKNVLDGNLGRLSVADGNLGLALSYNAAKTLNKWIGDEADLILIPGDDVERHAVSYPVIIQAILKPSYTEWGSLGLALVDSKFLSFIDEHSLSYQFALFGDGEHNFSPSDKVVYKRDQIAAASFPGLSDQSVNLIIGAMGAIVVYLLISREVKFSINRRLRTAGILSALGATKQTILKIFWVEQALKVIVASLLGSIIYKYLLMERFLGHYIRPNMWIILISIYIAIGLLSLKVAMRQVEATMREYSVPDIISKKPEEL